MLGFATEQKIVALPTLSGFISICVQSKTKGLSTKRKGYRQNERAIDKTKALMSKRKPKQSFCHAPAEISGCVLSMWFLSGFLTQEWRRWKRRAKLHVPGCIYRFALGFCKNIKKRTETLYQSFSPFMAES